MASRQSYSTLDKKGQKLVNLLDPTAAQDAATKSYVDTKVAAGGGVALATTTPAAESSAAVGAVGVGTTAARADHVHAMPTVPALSSTTPAQVSVTNVGIVGTGTTSARADHVHGIATVTQYDQRTVTSSTTVASITDEILFVPTTISTVQLPAASSCVPGKMIIVKSLGSGVTVTTAGGAIDNGLSKSVNIESWGARSYATDGTNWWAV